jgi:hypothetical protein
MVENDDATIAKRSSGTSSDFFEVNLPKTSLFPIAPLPYAFLGNTTSMG